MDRLLTRKLHHIGTGPLFMLTWPLYSSHPSSRFLCASVPLAFAARLVLIGAGLSRRGGDEVRSMTRGGDRAETLVAIVQETSSSVLHEVKMLEVPARAQLFGKESGGVFVKIHA